MKKAKVFGTTLENYLKRIAGNVNKILQTSFAGRTDSLEAACRRLEGRRIQDSAFDVAVELDFLPRIPVCLRFNDRDDEFPAQASMLFRQSAEAYLDMECLAIGATYLTGTLIRGIDENRPSD